MVLDEVCLLELYEFLSLFVDFIVVAIPHNQWHVFEQIFYRLILGIDDSAFNPLLVLLLNDELQVISYGLLPMLYLNEV